MTLKVQLSRGLLALIDDEDRDLIFGRRWAAAPAGCGKIYAVGYARPEDGVTTRQIKMHRLIMRPPPGLVVDHLNGNGLDNRRANMRVCTQSDNLRNTDRVRNQRPYQETGSSRWTITYTVNKCMVRERFDTEAEAWAAIAEVHRRLGTPKVA